MLLSLANLPTPLISLLFCLCLLLVSKKPLNDPTDDDDIPVSFLYINEAHMIKLICINPRVMQAIAPFCFPPCHPLQLCYGAFHHCMRLLSAGVAGPSFEASPS